MPSLVIGENVYSGYRSISKGLKEAGLIVGEDTIKSDISILSRREFLLQMNQNLFFEEFSNETVFRKFTEPALLTAKSRYWWNFICSRLSPLNNQVKAKGHDSLIQISVRDGCFISDFF